MVPSERSRPFQSMSPSDASTNAVDACSWWWPIRKREGRR